MRETYQEGRNPEVRTPIAIMGFPKMRSVYAKAVQTARSSLRENADSETAVDSSMTYADISKSGKGRI